MCHRGSEAWVLLNYQAVENMDANPDNRPAAEISEKNFEAEVLHSTQPVMVVFVAPWSRPCQVLESVLDEVVAGGAATVKLIKINADDNPELSLWYGIQSIPTLLYFAAGSLRAKVVGTASKEAIVARLQAVISSRDSGPAASEISP